MVILDVIFECFLKFLYFSYLSIWYHHTFKIYKFVNLVFVNTTLIETINIVHFEINNINIIPVKQYDHFRNYHNEK